MPEIFTAGEPLAPPPPSNRPERPEKPPRKSKRDGRDVVRAGLSPLGVLGRIVSVVFGLAMVGAVIGGVVAYGAYRKFSAELPDIACRPISPG